MTLFVRRQSILMFRHLFISSSLHGDVETSSILSWLVWLTTSSLSAPPPAEINALINLKHYIPGWVRPPVRQSVNDFFFVVLYFQPRISAPDKARSPDYARVFLPPNNSDFISLSNSFRHSHYILFGHFSFSLPLFFLLCPSFVVLRFIIRHNFGNSLQACQHFVIWLNLRFFFCHHRVIFLSSSSQEPSSFHTSLH